MARTTDPIPGAPCWIDLLTSDRARSAEFYGELLGWTAGDPVAELGGYVNFSKDGLPVAGCMQRGPDMCGADVWSVYLASDDAQKSVDVATAQGAGVIVPPQQVSDLGAFAMLSDPTGAGIGIWQPNRHRGFELLGEPGAPAWFELVTRDYPAALEFYRTAFGWETRTVSDTGEFRYSVLADSGAEYAGVMDAAGWLPAEVPPHWRVYFAVEDTDAAVDRVQRLGGTVREPAQDTPYGRLAAVTDPTGAPFSLVCGGAQ